MRLQKAKVEIEEERRNNCLLEGHEIKQEIVGGECR